MSAQRQQPGPGQESVWDYPRPPRIETCSRHIEVIFNGLVIADTQRARRVVETSYPPTYYIPPEDVHTEYFFPSSHRTWCEWKGEACYIVLRVDERESQNAAWYYPEPNPEFEAIRNQIAFFPSRVDACYIDGERVQPQDSTLYGGWITHDIVGPFQGDQDDFGA